MDAMANTVVIMIMAVSLFGMSREVFPVVIFCRIECIQRDNLRDGGLLPQVSFIEFSDKFLGNCFLFLVAVENSRTVLRAHIRTLPIQCCWVMDGEENLQNLPIRNLGRIEAHLDCLSVAGLAGADLLVGRIDSGATCVAGNHILDAVNFA